MSLKKKTRSGETEKPTEIRNDSKARKDTEPMDKAGKTQQQITERCTKPFEKTHENI